MKILKLTVIFVFVLAAALTFAFKNSVKSQETYRSASRSDDRIRQQRFRHSGVMDNEESADRGDNRKRDRRKEAPAGFDNLTNGFNEQGPAFETINSENAVALRSFNDNRFIFEEVETVADGIGPIYNAQSCRECHQNVVTGGASQVTVQRTGPWSRFGFLNHWAVCWCIPAPLIPILSSASLLKTTSELFAFRRTLWATDLSKQSPMKQSRHRKSTAAKICAVRFFWFRCLKATAMRDSGVSAGKTNTPVSNLFSADAYLNEMASPAHFSRRKHIRRNRCQQIRYGCRSRR